jgi:hypothetical protein
MLGDLSETSAADACRELARRGVTGALALDGPDGPGRILFVDGRLIAAVSPTPRARLGDRLVGAGLLQDDALTTALRIQADAPGRTRLGALLVERGLVGHDAVRLFVQEQLLDAMFEIIGWRYGTFEFAEGRGAEVPEVPLQLSVDDALVEVARRQQEWEELSQLIPDLEAIPAFRDPGSTASASLEPDEFAVLASVDGDRSIRELAADLGYGEFEAARIIYGLALLGIVEVRLPEDEVGAALDEALAFFAEPPTSDADAADGEPSADEEAGEDAEAGVEAGADADAETDDAEGERRLGDAPVRAGDVGDVDDPWAEPEHDSELAFVLELPAEGPAVAADDHGPADGEPAVDDDQPAAEADAPAAGDEPDADDVEPWVAAAPDPEPLEPNDLPTEEDGQPTPLDDLAAPAAADARADAEDEDEDEAAAASGDQAGRHPQDDDLGAILTAFREEPPPGAQGSDPVGSPARGEAELEAPVDLHADDDHSPPDDTGAPPEGPPRVDAPTFVDAPAAGQVDSAPAPATDPPVDPPRREVGPASSDDVSEFLRELSRLAIEAPPPQQEPQPRSDDAPAPPPPSQDDGKKKKRGLFGWGG